MRAIAPSPDQQGRSACRHRLVDAALEAPVEAEHARVGEGQDLRHDDSGDAPRRIEPEIAVEDAAPAQRSGAAALRSRLDVDHAGEPPSERAAGEEIDVVRAL